MESLPAAQTTYVRTLLVLGRASNLPTVWSNCLAGWFLGGGGAWSDLLLLWVAASCLYTGGMYLNDAFDVEFDKQHRNERPIPSGAITRVEVWAYGTVWLVLGTLLMCFFSKTTIVLTLSLLFSIVLYDAVHKAFAFSPVLMAACRFFLLITAASTGDEGVTGWAVWGGLALACYIIGVSYLARGESTRGALKYWPCFFMAAPLILAWLMNHGDYRLKSGLLSLILSLWIIRNLRFTFWTAPKNVGRTVSGLLAGIVLVDLLSIAGGSPALTLLFLMLFGLTLLFQRFIPAT